MDSTGLLLMGGGSRAAYQVGVLRGIARLAREVSPDTLGTPFDVICGTSAGAINSVGLARGAQDFVQATEALVQLWAS
ncbi:patatin-like phospholipase family protein, partial [Ralstonia sp.]